MFASRPLYYFGLEDEEKLLARLREYSGGKLDHRLRVLLKNYKEDQDNVLIPGITVTTVPQAIWPLEFANPLKLQVIPAPMMILADSFTAAYRSKFQQRKLIFLGAFGTAELIMDRRITLKVATIQAAALMQLEQMGAAKNEKIADYLGVE